MTNIVALKWSRKDIQNFLSEPRAELTDVPEHAINIAYDVSNSGNTSVMGVAPDKQSLVERLLKIFSHYTDISDATIQLSIPSALAAEWQR